MVHAKGQSLYDVANMNFTDYQQTSRSTAIYPNVGNNFVYPTLGLAGEAGEVAEKVKKIIRDAAGVASEEKKLEISKELGDVLWYVAQIASEFGLDLQQVAQGNLDKLRKRQEEGKLHGNGDNR